MFCILSFGCFSFLPLIFVIIYLWSIQITGPVASPTVCCRLLTRGFSSTHCCGFCRSFKFPARSRDWSLILLSRLWVVMCSLITSHLVFTLFLCWSPLFSVLRDPFIHQQWYSDAILSPSCCFHTLDGIIAWEDASPQLFLTYTAAQADWKDWIGAWILIHISR